MAWWAPIAAAGISALGSFLGGREESKGQRQANEQNLKIAREQMAFQERMSNTAHQREIADFKKAGINPILTAGGKGATAPMGATATMINEKTGVASGIEKATSALSLMQGLENINLTRQQAETTRQQGKVAGWDANLKQVQTNAILEKYPEEKAKLLAEIRRIKEDTKTSALDNVGREQEAELYQSSEIFKIMKVLGIDPNMLMKLFEVNRDNVIQHQNTRGKTRSGLQRRRRKVTRGAAP